MEAILYLDERVEDSYYCRVGCVLNNFWDIQHSDAGGILAYAQESYAYLSILSNGLTLKQWSWLVIGHHVYRNVKRYEKFFIARKLFSQRALRRKVLNTQILNLSSRTI
jgi:hypothetical protein